jgi:hypothetical protein
MKPRERPPTEARCGTLHEGPGKDFPRRPQRGSQDLPRRPRCPRQRLAKPGTSQAFQTTRSRGTSPMHTSLASDAATGHSSSAILGYIADAHVSTLRPSPAKLPQDEPWSPSVDRVRHAALASAATLPVPQAVTAPSATAAPSTPGGPRSSRLFIQASHASGKVHEVHKGWPGLTACGWVWARTGTAIPLSVLTPDLPKCSRCFARTLHHRLQ